MAVSLAWDHGGREDSSMESEAERRDVASLWISDHVIFPRTAAVVLEFRRDDLGQMLEILDLMCGDIRPAVDRA
jgi:hypothetical protein